MKQIRKFLFCILMLFAATAMAQNGIFYDTSDGLSSSFVNNVYQDKQGFMWISTYNGLNMYDGYRFTVYTPQHGLTSDNVTCCREDARGTLLVGTTRGLCYRSNGTFHLMKYDDSGEDAVVYINTLYTGPDKKIYVGTSGGGLFIVTPQLTLKSIYEEIDDINFVYRILTDRRGTMFLFTPKHGVTSITPDKRSPRGYTTRNYALGKMETDMDACIDADDNIYLGTMGQGVLMLDTRRTAFRPIASTAGLSVTSLMPEENHCILVGTNGNGVKRLNTLTGKLSDTNIYSNELNMQHTKVYSLSRDHNDNLWLGLLQKGLFMQPKTSSPFGYVGYKRDSRIGDACVLAMHCLSNGSLLIATDQHGIYLLDKDMNFLRHYQPGQGSLPRTVMCINEAPDGRVWIGSYTEGGGWLDLNSGTYHRMPFTYGNAQNVLDIRCDNKGIVWIATLGDGLKRYDTATGNVREYHSGGHLDAIPNEYCTELELSRDGRLLFVGTATGLSCLNTVTDKWNDVFPNYQLIDNEVVTDIRMASDNEVWTTTTAHLYHINIKQKSVKRIEWHDKPYGISLQAVQPEDKNHLWISTNSGLRRIDITTLRAMTYHEQDGLQSNEFSDGATAIAPDGRLFFGGVGGVTHFMPQSVQTNKDPLDVVLSGLFMGNEEVQSGSRSNGRIVCDTLVSMATRFDFSHKDNTLTLFFSTLTYNGADHIVYQYSLNDAEWVSLPSGTNMLRLAQLSPGDYNVRVKAIDNGVESPIKTYTIVIHNVWYFTPLARIIYCLLIILAIYLYIRDMQRRNRERLKLMEQIQVEELNGQKLQFFIDLSHEIRTPMTLIVSPLQQLMKDDDDAHRRGIYEVMQRNANRILHLVNQIMDIRKVDKGLMAMHMQPTDMVEFIDGVVQIFAPQAKNKQIQLTFTHPMDTLEAYIDRSNFDKVLMNLLSNALKYTRAGGRIDISLQRTDDSQMLLSVFDDGEKIPQQSIDHIFERFYQAPNRVNQTKTGTGVGLNLARSLVELHHGTIAARNTDEGVVFTVTIPLGSSHLSDSEIMQTADDNATLPAPTDEPQAPAMEATPVNDTATPPPAPSKRPTIVIVEDDDEIREYMKNELSATYRPVTFSDGAEALPFILREIPQMVISDIMMPQMDGTTLCSSIKGNVNTNHIPIILLTAKTRDEDKMEGLEVGADLYVTKPFNMDLLRRNIQNLLASRKLLENKFTGQEDQTDKVDQVELETADERLLNRIMAVVNANLNNSSLNIDMICQEVGISRVHLNRKMKEFTNQTPYDFIRNLRLKQAARLLAQKGQSVTEVMYRCGFNSATSFSTMFKKMYGMSPRDYKRTHEEE